MRLARFFSIVLGAIALCGINPASADDLFPPDFRGLPGSMTAEWDFGDPANPDYADSFNLTELPGADVFPVYPLAELINLSWTVADGDGGWFGLGGGGIVNIAMPNFIDQLPRKEIWVQIKYVPGGASPYVTAVEAFDEEAGQVLGTLNGSIDNPDFGFRVESWQILPNPDFELIQIYVPAAVTIDQVVVDTISTVPEVSTLALCGGSILVLAVGARLRRRRSE